MTATLIVAHRRVDTVRLVAHAVIEAGAQDVWAWVDGPRTAAEATQTTEVASLLRSQPWPGEFNIVENHANHGVARAVPAALDWVFASREQAVVLEDDCLPAQEFFAFVECMLERYRNASRVAIVSGTRLAGAMPARSAHPYEFSTFPLIWGWATWRDRWTNYEHDIRGWRRELPLRLLLSEGGLLHAWDWYRLFNSVASEDPWSWDYQLTYMLWRRHQLAVIPPVDLVCNVGFGQFASHTVLAPSYAPVLPSPAVRQGAISAVVDSPFVPPEPSDSLDRRLRRLVFSPPLVQRVRNRLAISRAGAS